MVTIFDVAKKAGVSYITVSRLMNNPAIVSSETAKRIHRAMELLNYQPSQIARSLIRKRTNTIGVVLPDIKNSFFNSWFCYIQEIATEHSFNIILFNTDEDRAKELKYIKQLHLQRVDGVIIAPNSKESIEYLIKTKMPFILFDRHFKNLKTSYVATDHFQGGFDATEYLLKLGHKKIAVLRVPQILYPDNERFSGFENAMQKHGIYIRKNLILNSELNEGHAYNLTKELLTGDERPTAIFALNSLLTKGSLKYIQRMSISIPDDISLIGFDEFPGHDIVYPRITNVIQPVDSLGRDAISALINMINNPAQTKRVKISLRPELVIGGSCRNIN